MLGKRRFITILIALALCAGVEIVNGGWSGEGQLALLGIVGFYFGGDAMAKRAKYANEK